MPSKRERSRPVEMVTFGKGQGYLKAGFLGFNKSGKTYTAGLLLSYLHEKFGLKTPIAIFDTEAGAEYIAPRLTVATGQPPIGCRSRSMADLLALGRKCVEGAAEILLVDSITHVWRDVCDCYLDQVNAARDQQNKSRRTRLEFQDWANIKAVWARWTEFYTNSRLHIVICGRAGFEWDFEETEDATGNTHKELVKTGIKMKVESEFGFEPSLLVEFERVQIPDPKKQNKFTFTHRATVLGDRFDVMDAQTTDNPKGEWFDPHISMLSPGQANFVDTTLKTDMGVDEKGDAEFQRERRQRTILGEEIQAAMIAAYPGQTKEEKQAKALLLKECFETGSWTKVEGMGADRLREGLTKVREWIAAHNPGQVPEKGDDA
jgi:hypothetical protein